MKIGKKGSAPQAVFLVVTRAGAEIWLPLRPGHPLPPALWPLRALGPLPIPVACCMGPRLLGLWPREQGRGSVPEAKGLLFI